MDNSKTRVSQPTIVEHNKCVALQADVLEKDEEAHKIMIDSIEALGCQTSQQLIVKIKVVPFVSVGAHFNEGHRLPVCARCHFFGIL